VLENQLKAYFADPAQFGTAWSALLNTVLAAGSRALLSTETPDAFQQSGREGWAYFQNSIDVLAQLLCKPATVMGVQV
jgi:hypothetical protein